MRKPLAIIGMSPGNSYFKDYEVKFLLQEAIKRFGKCVVVVADVPAISTYMALGYSPGKARNKAIPKGNNLKNRTRRIAEELGFTEDQVRIIDWSDEVEPNAHYQEHYKKILQKYNETPDFSRDIRHTSKMVIEQTGRVANNLDTAVEQATHYILSEFAFMEFAPEYLGYNRVCYLYHRNWPVYEDYITGKNDGVRKPHLDFLLLEAPYEKYAKIHKEDISNGCAVHDTYTRILKTGMVRAAYIDYPPIIQKNAHGFSGIFYDIIRGFSETHGWSIEWVEETGYGDVTQGLAEGRFDIFCAATWPTIDRHCNAFLSHPIYYSDVGIWVREDSELIGQDYLELDHPDHSIAITENDITHQICLTDFTRSKWVRAPQMGRVRALLELVANKKATATMVENITYQAYAENLSCRLVNLAVNKPIRRFANCFLLGKNQSDFKDLLDDYIVDLIQTGQVHTLMNLHGLTQTGIYIPKIHGAGGGT